MLDRFKIMKINVKIDSYKWHIIMTMISPMGQKIILPIAQNCGIYHSKHHHVEPCHKKGA
jgi:hypothetical protein